MMCIVKHIRFILAATLLLTTGCDRGSHPRQTGRVAPDFTVTDSSRSIHLANYRGKVVVLNFWATWCAPCAAEWPSLEQLQQKFPNLVVLAVASTSNPGDYRQYVIDNQAPQYDQSCSIPPTSPISPSALPARRKPT